jgi:hypothetical protein
MNEPDRHPVMRFLLGGFVLVLGAGGLVQVLVGTLFRREV